MRKKMQTYKEEVQLLLKQNLPWERLAGKTVMISGATGMIGKCLIDILMQYGQEQRNHAGRNHSSGSSAPVKVIALSRNEENARQRLGIYWNDRNFEYIACDVNRTLPEWQILF